MILELVFVTIFMFVLSSIFVWEKFADYIFLRDCNNSVFFDVLNPKKNPLSFEYQTEGRFNISRINPIF